MKTLTGILYKINSWIITNGLRLITAGKLNEILTDLKTYLSDSRVVFGRFTVASFTNLDITQINAGDVIDNTTIATDDLILLCGQDDNLENGPYVIGQNPGGTVRHADFPDVAACIDTVFYGKANANPIKCYFDGNDYVFEAVTSGGAPQVQSDWNETNNTAVAYIKNKPAIPSSPVNADWNSTSGLSEILNKPTIPDLSDVSSVGSDLYLFYNY